MSRAARYLQLVCSGDEAALASQLRQIAAQMRIANVAVGFTGGGRRLFVSVGPEGKCTDRQTAQDSLIYAGCLAKPLTAALVAEAVAEGRLGWRDDVGKRLSARGITAIQLADVTVQQLLNHTHGLDTSSVKHVPRTIEGLIDTRALCETLNPRRLSAAGDLYSYGDAGAWLAGAVLETIYGKRYVELLYERRLVHDRNNTTLAADADICPATGGDLRLAAWEWLEFLETRGDHIAALGAEQVPLPGWGLLERGACPGWKSYAGGWLGHNSNDGRGSAVLRFHPRERLGIIASADDEGAAMLALAGLLGQVFPELFVFRMPRALAESDAAALPFYRYAGDYSRSDSSLGVRGGQGATLCLSLHDRHAGQVFPGRQLRLGKDDLFVPEVRDDPDFPFVQFVRPDAAGVFEYVWNGRQLWRRD